MPNLDDVLKRAESRQHNANFTEEERELLARYGAAYRVVYERLCPDQCGPAEWPKLASTAEIIGKWSDGLDQPLQEVYRRAVIDVVARASTRMENMRRGIQLARLYEDIPKPPLG